MNEKLSIEQKLNLMINSASYEGFVKGLEFAIEIIQKTLEELTKEQGK